MATDPLQRRILRTMLTREIGVKLGSGLYTVSPEGREALFVSSVAERWLQSSPGGPLDFEGPRAEAALHALVEGWHSTLIHALAPKPLVFEQLTEVVGGIRHGRLRRLLAALRRVGLIEAMPSRGDGVLYAVTDWLRAGLAPLAVAARLERRQQTAKAAPIDALDVDAAFQLALPTLELPMELTGVCRLGVNLKDEGRAALTGVMVEIDQGRVVACRSGLQGPADAWAHGSVHDWLDTVIEADADRVRTGGDRWLPAAVIRGLHKTLFGIPVA